MPPDMHEIIWNLSQFAFDFAQLAFFLLTLFHINLWLLPHQSAAEKANIIRMKNVMSIKNGSEMRKGKI